MPEPGISNVKQAVTTYLNIRGDLTQVLVSLATAARDGGLDGGGAATRLTPGMIVTKITGSGANAGKYSHFDASETTQADEAQSGILMDVIDDISTGDQQAHVAFGGGAIFKRSELRFFEAADKTAFEWEKFPVDTI